MANAPRNFLPGCIAPALLLATSLAADNPGLAESQLLTQQFAASLQQELKRALSAGGPVEAVAVCKERAPQIASELSRLSGAKIRRTSLRFRNPMNAPEAWESRVLAEFAAADAADPGEPLEYFELQDDGTIRYMSAIRTGGVCLACHGATLAEDLEEPLAVDYPHDRARGYSLGDLRGAFSVTWPAPAAAPGR